MKCENCGNKHDGTYGSGRFCNAKCAHGFSTKLNRKEISEKVSITLKGHTSPLKFYPIIRICEVCGNDFLAYNKTKKTCSRICQNYLLSVARSNHLLKNGTDNWKTKQELFSYDFVNKIKCDSKLEKAAIIYLIDIFKATSIERFMSILNFWEGKQHRTFNPDFFVKKNNEVYVVEVKMNWISNNEHDYNRTIPLKKIAIENFCKERKYNMLWLDFNYDDKFKKIYRQLK